MSRLYSILGYVGAVLSVVAMLLTPFVLMRLFSRAVAATGIQPDPIYSGGDLAARLPRNGYVIEVNHPVVPKAPLSPVSKFVQLTWTPAAALPGRVQDEVDIDQDGRPDLIARFDVPQDGKTELRVDVEPIGSSRARPLHNATRDSMDALITRVRGGIVVRVPLAD
ncbi:MAG: hypothetical protein HY898_18780 [Deltaproteobacteria bacterium]|nr:hypothetical protein [Deltaproteobacteria bacterium]